MTILEQMNHFSDRYGKSVIIDNTTRRYYCVGAGVPILWLTGGLVKFISHPEAEWLEAIHAVMHYELSRADVISHFAVAANPIRKGIVTSTAYQNWTGPIIVLSAENDPTQCTKDIPRYEKLFGRTVEVVNMGNMGHVASLFYPDKYVE